MEGECKKSQLLFYPTLGCFLKCQCRRSYCIVLCIYRVERESAMDILTKLSLKLPITTVNGRSSSADCWRLHGRSLLYTVLTLQCCRALLQPPGVEGGWWWWWLVLAAFISILVSQCSSQVQPSSSAPAPHICIQSTIDVARQKFLITSNIDNLSFPLKQQRH